MNTGKQALTETTVMATTRAVSIFFSMANSNLERSIPLINVRVLA